MDFTNYTGLKAAIATELARDDLTADIPGFIALAEAKMKRRIRKKTIRATITVTAESTALPAACAELRSIYALSGLPSLDRPLRLGTPEAVAEVRANHAGVPGRPVVFAIVDNNLICAPAPDQSYTFQITYYEALTPLSGSVTTNSILDDAPDAYFYGALYHAAPYLEHDERIPMWEDYFEKAVNEIDVARLRAETNASYRPARLSRVF